MKRFGPRRKFSLLAYVDGKRITLDNGKNGMKVPTPPPGASKFYLRYTDDAGKRQDEALGSDFVFAMSELRTRRAVRVFERETGTKVSTTPKVVTVSLHSSIETYLEEIRANRALETWRSYRTSLRWLDEFLPNRAVESITRSDLLRFKNFMVDKKYKPSSVYNGFLRSKIFLKKMGFPIQLERDDWPRNVPRDPEAYTLEQINAMLRVCTADETTFLKSLLYSGMRRGELQHLTYRDIDFQRSIWRVRPKNGWKPKKQSAERSILILPSLTQAIKERMELHKARDEDYVFPTPSGKADHNLLRILKQIAERAGIKGRVDLHKFRSTCATMRLRSGVDVREVATRLGHSNLKTISHYVEAMKLESPEAMEQNNKTFGGFDTIQG